MKVVHTWTSREMVWKELAYVHLASALSAKKHYGETVLYGDKGTIDQVKRLGIPYSEFIEVKKLDYNSTFSVAKLQTFSSLKSDEYLHIDTDTILFDKIDFSFTKSPFVFSHCDKYHPDNKVNHNEVFTEFLRSASLNREDSYYAMLLDVYCKPYFNLHSDLKSNIHEKLDFFSIPNMNINYVKDPKLFSEASEYATKHYFKHKEYIDSLDLGACYVEQFLIHSYLRAYSEEYEENSTNFKHVLHRNNPFLQLNEGQTPKYTPDSFPFNFSFENSICKCCGSKGEEGELSIHNEEELKKLPDLDYGDYLHFSFMKWYDIWQYFVINYIVNNFGEEYVLNLHKHYLTAYDNKTLPHISGGEKLYEKLSGVKLFSK